jgi:hypothetical protein
VPLEWLPASVAGQEGDRVGKRELEVLGDIEWELRKQREEREERYYRDNPRPEPTYSKGGPLSRYPRLKTLRFFTTGVHFLAALPLLLPIIDYIVTFYEDDDPYITNDPVVGRTVVLLAGAAISVVLVAAFLVVARVNKVALREGLTKRLGRTPIESERRHTYSIWQLPLVATRSVAWVGLGLGVWSFFQGPFDGFWVWVASAFLAVVSLVALTPLFNGMYAFRSVMSTTPDWERDGY